MRSEQEVKDRIIELKMNRTRWNSPGNAIIDIQIDLLEWIVG